MTMTRKKMKSKNGKEWRVGGGDESATGLLLDCGEGTFGQLLRLNGVKQARKIVAGLACVFISHMHADHHIGLCTVLQEYTRERRRNAHKIYTENGAKRGKLAVGGSTSQQRRLLIVGPVELGQWLEEYQACAFSEELTGGEKGSAPSDEFSPQDSPPPRYFDFVPCSSIPRWQNQSVEGPAENAISPLARLKEMSGVSLVAVPVRHCRNSWAVVINHITGWKVVYSGDCMPSDSLTQVGAGASLLIHEATMEDGLEKEAREKNHSTTQQALSIASKMQAKRTILTHFSQRYPKLPNLGWEAAAACNVSNAKKDEERSHVVIAFDYMKVSLSSAEWAPKLLPIFHALFPPEEQLQESSAAASRS